MTNEVEVIDDKQKKLTPAQLIHKFNITLPRITKEHIRNCPYWSAIVRENIARLPDTNLWEEAVEKAKMLEAHGILNSEDQILRDAAVELTFREAQEKRQEFCPHEKQEVIKLLEQLEQIYDIRNPKLMLAIREVLQQYMVLQRFDEDSLHGALFHHTRNGMIINPSISYRGAFSKTFIDSLEKLDKMSRDNVQFSFEGELSFADVLKKIKQRPEE